MAGGPAGAVASAGSSAGFAAAGGLDVKAEDVVATTHATPASTVVAAAAAAAPDAAATTTSMQYSSDDPLRDSTLPDDVAELQSMVRKSLALKLRGGFYVTCFGAICEFLMFTPQRA